MVSRLSASVTWVVRCPEFLPPAPPVPTRSGSSAICWSDVTDPAGQKRHQRADSMAAQILAGVIGFPVGLGAAGNRSVPPFSMR